MSLLILVSFSPDPTMNLEQFIQAFFVHLLLHSWFWNWLLNPVGKISIRTNIVKGILFRIIQFEKKNTRNNFETRYLLAFYVYRLISLSLRAIRKSKLLVNYWSGFLKQKIKFDHLKYLHLIWFKRWTQHTHSNAVVRKEFVAK